jgi:TrmH family RNA methyltransferase
VISSSQNAKVKFARSLAGRSKERTSGQAFLGEGVRLLEEAVTANWPVRYVLYSEALSGRGKTLLGQMQERNIDADEVQPGLLDSISETATSQGILAVLEDRVLPIPGDLNFALILDAVREPGNVGTLLRTAAAAGVQTVFVAPGTADPLSPKVVRAGMGAHFRLPIHCMEWEGIQQRVDSAGLAVYLADMHGRPFWEVRFPPAVALLVGSEAAGAGEAGRELAGEAISVPMEGQVESLNAAVAGSVLMFEVLRQRRLSI